MNKTTNQQKKVFDKLTSMREHVRVGLERD